MSESDTTLLAASAGHIHVFALTMKPAGKSKKKDNMLTDKNVRRWYNKRKVESERSPK